MVDTMSSVAEVVPKLEGVRIILNLQLKLLYLKPL